MGILTSRGQFWDIGGASRTRLPATVLINSATLEPFDLSTNQALILDALLAGIPLKDENGNPVTWGDASPVYPGYPETPWTYPAATGGILNTTTAVTIKAAPGAGLRNYISGIQISAEALGTATEVAIRDGAAGTVLWRTKIGTGGLVGGREIEFTVPLRGSDDTLLEVVTLTASGTGAVYFNAQGYVA